LQGIASVEPPSNPFGLSQWVLSRALCRFKILDMSQIPAIERSRALRLELMQLSPFRNSAHYIAWHNGRALVWIWDDDRLRQSVESHGMRFRQSRIIPETLLHPPQEEGLRLVRCIDGFEGQLWHCSVLERCRWWPHVPSAAEWLMFQRDSGVLPERQQAESPAAVSVPLGHQPWIGQNSIEASPINLKERLVLAGAAVVLLVPTLWYAVSLYKLEKHARNYRAELDNLQVQVIPIAKARGQALDLLARAREIESIKRYPQQLQMLSRFVVALPDDGTFFRFWDFHEGKLKVGLVSTHEIPVAEWVGNLQHAGLFQNVTSLPGNMPNTLVLQMDVPSK